MAKEYSGMMFSSSSVVIDVFAKVQRKKEFSEKISWQLTAGDTPFGI